MKRARVADTLCICADGPLSFTRGRVWDHYFTASTDDGFVSVVVVRPARDGVRAAAGAQRIPRLVLDMLQRDHPEARLFVAAKWCAARRSANDFLRLHDPARRLH